MRGAWPAALALGTLALLQAGPVAAELYRCQGPEGHTVFTDQKDTCPGADPFEPSGVVLEAPTPQRTRPADPDPESGPGALSNDEIESPEEAMERHWRQKKEQAEARLAQIRDDREEMRSYMIHCNRGGWVYRRDDAGIRQKVECDEIRRAFSALEDLEAKALAYLNGGLREECRRSGCLPGWIR